MTTATATTWEHRLLRGLDDDRGDLVSHLDEWGPIPRTTGEELVRAVHDSGLLGRGGAGFPTGRKLAAFAAGGRRAVIVANGAEGEPASAKDYVLLTRAPHLVLDGIQLAARAVDAREAYLVVHGGTVVQRLRAAISERRDPVQVQLRVLPTAYVASEETAIVSFLNGKAAKPTFAPPRPFESGVRGRATLVNNVETLAQIAMIARYGAEWFRDVGDPDEPGTLLVTVTAGEAGRGVAEVPTGTPIGAVLEAGGVEVARTKAVLVGGYFGSWMPVDVAAQLPLSHHAMRAAGGALGAGILFALPHDRCGLAETARVASYLADQNAGQCGPCLNGLPAIADALQQLAFGDWREGHWPSLERWLSIVPGRGACRHPDGAVRFVVSALTTFAADVSEHRAGRRCGASTAPALLPTPGPPETRS